MTMPKSLPLIAAALTMSLAACTTGSRDPEGVLLNAGARIIQPACPTPSDKARMTRILAELDGARLKGADVSALATEWERLDAQARVCRRLK